MHLGLEGVDLGGRHQRQDHRPLLELLGRIEHRWHERVDHVPLDPDGMTEQLRVLLELAYLIEPGHDPNPFGVDVVAFGPKRIHLPVGQPGRERVLVENPTPLTVELPNRRPIRGD